MSDNIPFELQVEIMKRLPVRSLIQFRSVSKRWKSLIDTPHFITRYTAQHTHLLIAYFDSTDLKQKYVSIPDHDHYTFPQYQISPSNHMLVNLLRFYYLVGCSHGLLCLYGVCGYTSPKPMAVLWNMSIRKAVAVTMPDSKGETFVSFGVCPETSEPKLVRISHANMTSDIFSSVEVFTLSSGAWRSSYSHLPRKSIHFEGYNEGVQVDGFLYWLAKEMITMEAGSTSYYLIVSFDLTTEEFKEVNLPDSLALAVRNNHYLCISKLRNSLVVIDSDDGDVNNRTSDVWMMGDSVPQSFTKLYTLNINTQKFSVRGFTKTGAPIVENLEDVGTQVVFYEPHSRYIDSLLLHEKQLTMAVYPYAETLLLLDQPDLKVYNDI